MVDESDEESSDESDEESSEDEPSPARKKQKRSAAAKESSEEESDSSDGSYDESDSLSDSDDDLSVDSDAEQEERKVAKSKSAKKKRGRAKAGPLGGHAAKWLKSKTPAGPTSTATKQHHSGVDLDIINALHGAGQRRLGKLFQLANDPGATTAERERAKKKLDAAIASGDDDVLEAMKVLEQADGKSIAPKPGLQKVAIEQHGEPCKRRQKWFNTLAHAFAILYGVDSCVFLTPRMYGFYGRDKGAEAAAADFEKTFNFVVGVAPTHSFCQGFTDGLRDIVSKMSAAREASRRSAPNSTTAIVLRTNSELIKDAIDKFGLNFKSTALLKGQNTTTSDYREGENRSTRTRPFAPLYTKP